MNFILKLNTSSSPHNIFTQCPWHGVMHNYSGPSQQRPTSLQRPKRRVRIDFSIDLTHFEPPNNGNGNLQTPASGQRPGSGTLDLRRKLPPRTTKLKKTPLFVKPHPLLVRRIHCNIHPYKGHLSTRAKRSDPKVALLRRFRCIH